MSRLSELRETNRLKMFIGALAIALAGLIFLTLPYFLGLDPSRQENISGFLRDVGTALLISGLLGAIFEYSARRNFIAEVAHTLKEVITERYWILEQAHRSGVDSIHPRLPSNLTDKFERASSIRILQTWIGNLEDISESLCIAANNDCDVRILLLDANSVQACYRSIDKGHNDKAYVKGLIESNLFQLHELGSRPATKGNIEVRLYDATPIFTIYGYDNIDIVGMYWRNKAAISSPQFEVNRQENIKHSILQPKSNGYYIENNKNDKTKTLYFAQAVREHFEDLWGEAVPYSPQAGLHEEA